MRISIFREAEGGYEQWLKVRDQAITVTLDGVEQDVRNVAMADEEQSVIHEIVRNGDGTAAMFEGEIATVPKFGAVVITCTERPFDAQAETLKHIIKVRENLQVIIDDLTARASLHDESKFSAEEAPYLQQIGELQQREGKVNYGTPEYQARAEILAPMLEHHYKHNDHHIQHHGKGIFDMNLMQLVEMFADICASGVERNEHGVVDLRVDVLKRQGIPWQIASILQNTAVTMGVPCKI